MTTNSIPGMLPAADVMALFGYRDRKSFWEFIHRHKVPHVRFNKRVIRFEPGPLEDWVRLHRRGTRTGRDRLGLRRV